LFYEAIIVSLAREIYLYTHHYGHGLIVLRNHLFGLGQSGLEAIIMGMSYISLILLTVNGVGAKPTLAPRPFIELLCIPVHLSR
jgi:hypothetical protein